MDHRQPDKVRDYKWQTIFNLKGNWAVICVYFVLVYSVTLILLPVNYHIHFSATNQKLLQRAKSMDFVLQMLTFHMEENIHREESTVESNFFLLLNDLTSCICIWMEVKSVSKALPWCVEHIFTSRPFQRLYILRYVFKTITSKWRYKFL